MTLTFAILAVLTVAGSVAAMGLRNLVHCALALTVAFAGLAMIYLQLDAQFVGFAQLLVYVGAVAILIVFAILLTRTRESDQGPIFSATRAWGVVIAAVVFGLLVGMVAASRLVTPDIPPVPAAGVAQIGALLMFKYLLPLEVTG